MIRRPETAASSVRGSLAGRTRSWISVTTVHTPTVWLATADGLVLLDLLAVELAVNGRRTRDWSLSGPEGAFAADLLLQRGTERSEISRLTGCDYRTLRRWFPTDDTALSDALTRVRTQAEINRERTKGLSTAKGPARCGTYQGAQRHRRAREPLDPLCRQAKQAADRFYSKHGTYIGCPEFTS